MLTGSGYVYTRRAMHKIYRKYIENSADIVIENTDISRVFLL